MFIPMWAIMQHQEWILQNADGLLKYGVPEGISWEWLSPGLGMMTIHTKQGFEIPVRLAEKVPEGVESGTWTSRSSTEA